MNKQTPPAPPDPITVTLSRDDALLLSSILIAWHHEREKVMQATINYTLTESAQRAQMAATGQPVAREQSMTIEVTADDLPLCDVAPDGALTISPRKYDHQLQAAGWNGTSASPHATVLAPDVLADIRKGEAILAAAYTDACQVASEYVLATPELSMEKPESAYHLDVPFTVLPKSQVLNLHPKVDKKWDHYGIYSHHLSELAQAALRERYAANKAAKHAKDSAAIDAFLADANARYTGSLYYSNAITLPLPGGGRIDIYSSSPRRNELVAEIERRNKADEEAREAAKAATEEAKVAYISAWIAEHAEESVRQQYADGLLCRQTAVFMIADYAFAELPGAAPDHHSCEDRNCPCGSNTVTCLPRRIYPIWREMRAKLPQGFTAEFESRRDCLKPADGYWEYPESPTAGPKYWVATITIPHGPFKFTRTVKLG